MKPVDFVTDKVALCAMTRCSGSMVQRFNLFSCFLTVTVNREPGTVNLGCENIVQGKGKIKKNSGATVQRVAPLRIYRVLPVIFATCRELQYWIDFC